MATEADNVNSGALGTLLAVGAFATLGIALVVTALVRSEMSEEAEKKEVSADRPYRDLVAEQTAKLSAPAAYINRGSGLVSLPIERAMELTVEGLKKDPNSATPPAAALGGSAGSAPEAAAVGGGGAGGTGGGPSEGTANVAPGEPPHEAVGVKLDESDQGKADKEQADKEKTGTKPEKKKEAPKQAPKPAAAPGAPASPAAPAPAPPSSPPNGQ
jgi:hypothetical protein